MNDLDPIDTRYIELARGWGRLGFVVGLVLGLVLGVALSWAWYSGAWP